MIAEDLFWLIAGAIVPSFLVACLSTWVVSRLAPSLGLLDKPNARKMHSTPIPLGGGIGLFLGVLIPLSAGGFYVKHVAALEPTEQAQWIPAVVLPHLVGLVSRLDGLMVLLGCGLVLVLLGLADDRFGLDWRFRLVVQFAVAWYCVWQQGWRLTAFIELPHAGWIPSIVLSMLWIVTLINSFNMLDNMDGLAGGVAAIAAAMLALVLLISPDPQTHRPQLFVAGLLLVLTGSLLGFLCHNFPPAKIFMGDAGSYFVGFCIAVSTLLATYTSYKSDRPHAMLAPLFVMAVPLYDMTTVLYIRLKEGRSLFQADKKHFSHRLVELGFSKPAAVWTIYLMTATCSLGAVLLHRVDLAGAVVILLMIVCVLSLIALLESTARSKFDGKGNTP